MRNSLKTVLLLSTLSAQVLWQGYFEAEGDALTLPQQQVLYGYHKFRLDMWVRPSSQLRIAADLVAREYYGQTRLNLLDFIPPEIAERTLGTLPGAPAGLPYELADTLFLDNAFLELHHPRFDLILGRQQIAAGVGYVWNPTDIFNIPDIMDPTYENEGLRALRLNLPLGRGVSVNGILQPQASWRNTTRFYALKSIAGGFDLELVYGCRPYAESGLTSGFRTLRELAGFSAEGSLRSLGIRTEQTFSRLHNQSGKVWHEYILGVDYTFENSVYCLGEFFHSDFGVETATLESYLHYFAGVRKSVNRNYFYGMFLFPLTDLLSAGAFLVSNLEDGSLLVTPQCFYNAGENVDLSLLVSLFAGDPADEFGYQQAGMRLRLRAWF